MKKLIIVAWSTALLTACAHNHELQRCTGVKIGPLAFLGPCTNLYPGDPAAECGEGHIK